MSSVASTKADAARIEAARIVVESGAIHTRTGGDPFFFTSGWASPIFIDVKQLISFTPARDKLIEMALARIGEFTAAEPIDMIAGCELAGIPFAAILADRLRLPLAVVRKQSKGFGRLSQCEGVFEPGARALLVDDLSTDGINKSNFRSALERAEAVVVETFVLLSYDIFPSGRKVASLLTLADIIRAAEQTGRLDGRALNEVQAFAADAPRWSKRNGGIGALPA